MENIKQGTEKKIKVSNSYENCLTQIIIKEMWTKPMRYHFLPKDWQKNRKENPVWIICIED